MSKLGTKIIDEKIEEVFNELSSAAKINIALSSFFEILRLVNINTSTPMKTPLCLKIPLTTYESGFNNNPRKSRKV